MEIKKIIVTFFFLSRIVDTIDVNRKSHRRAVYCIKSLSTREYHFKYDSNIVVDFIIQNEGSIHFFFLLLLT